MANKEIDEREICKNCGQEIYYSSCDTVDLHMNHKYYCENGKTTAYPTHINEYIPEPEKPLIEMLLEDIEPKNENKKVR